MATIAHSLCAVVFVACYGYQLYRASKGHYHVPDVESGAPESHSVPQLVRSSSRD